MLKNQTTAIDQNEFAVKEYNYFCCRGWYVCIISSCITYVGVSIKNTLCYAMLCYAMPCHAMPCHAMPCYAMLSYALVRYVTLRYVT